MQTLGLIKKRKLRVFILNLLHNDLATAPPHEIMSSSENCSLQLKINTSRRETVE